MQTYLREATAGAHARVEKCLAIMDPELTLSRYRAVITAFYSIYSPLEQRLGHKGGNGALGDFTVRQCRTSFLHKDLIALGTSVDQIDSISSTRYLPELPTAAHVIGAMYVTEGATLGGQYIARHVRSRLGLSPAGGLSFFTQGGKDPSETTASWHRFRAFLNDQPEADKQSITAGALATFACFEQTFAELS